MTWDTARRALNFLKNHSAKSKEITVSFYGGEPLMKFGLIKKAVSYSKRIIKDKKLTFYITTNGTLLDHKRCKFLIKNKFYLTISLDGPKDVHDRHRVYINGMGSFDSVIKGINLLKSMDNKYFINDVRFNTVVCPHYKFKDIADFFVKNLLVDPHKEYLQYISLSPM